MGSSKNALLIVGALLALLGLAGLVIPTFSTEKTSDVASIGNLKLQTQQKQFYDVPAPVAGGVLALGVVLMVGGLYRRA